jgi:hypothetical protein
MATAINKGFSVGDTVYVRYPYSGDATGWYPATRVVSAINFTGASDVCSVSFSDGVSVDDSAATQRVYTTAALCATGIVNSIITLSSTTVELDATLSVASTVSQNAVSLRRVSS